MWWLWEQSGTEVNEQSNPSHPMAAVVTPFQVIKYCLYALLSLCLLSLITSFQLPCYDSVPITRDVQFLEKESCWCNKQTMNCGHEEKVSLHGDLCKLVLLYRKFSISLSMNEQNINSSGIECTVYLNITMTPRQQHIDFT